MFDWFVWRLESKRNFMDTKKFKRKKESFICQKCGEEISGDGYTNHCPRCLWSRHVDIYPGDRAAVCKGFMRPIGVEFKKGEYIILHRCVKCGYERKNKASGKDDFEAILGLAKA